MNANNQHASVTSQVVAGLRAAHQLLDGNPKVMEDSLILKLLGSEAIALIKENPDRYQTIGALKLRAHILLRSRYAEDCLKKAYDNGIRQYLILGAGLDTFAYRQQAWSQALQIYEVDHPATQSQKITRLQESGIEIPNNLHFVPIDFESTSLYDGLSKSAFDLKQPVFISWLGVTMYLTTDAINAVLGFVASLPEMSELVFTFAQPKTSIEPEVLASNSAKVDEPWLSYFTVESLEEKLRSYGFKKIFFLDPDEAKRSYFNDRDDGLEPSGSITIAQAVV